jgi:hypothetical protein
MGLGFAHFGALASIGKDQRASTACKCFAKFRLWLIIKMTSNVHFFPTATFLLVLKALCA